MYIIKDWANNVLFNAIEFTCFDDAWGFIYEQFPDEENFDDYYIEEA